MNKWGDVLFRSYKSPLLRKTVLFYSIMVLLVITVVSIVTLNLVSGYLKKDAEKSVEMMNRQTYNAADLLLSSTYAYFARVFNNNSELFSAMYDESYTPIQSKRISDVLVNLKSSNPLIESIYIYNIQHDTVFSSETTAMSLGQSTDQGMVQLLSSEHFLKNGFFIPRQAHISQFPPYDVNVISLVFSQVQNTRFVEGAFIINLSQEKLQRLVLDGGGDHTRQSIIVTKAGMVLSHDDQSLFSHNIASDKYMEHIVSSEEPAGQFNAKLDGKNYWFYFQKNESLGLTYISRVEEQNMLVLVNRVQGVIIGISVLFTVMVIISILFSIRKFYAPVQHIARRIGQTANHQIGSLPSNEYDLIETWLLHQESKLKELESSISGYLNAGRREALHTILKGNPEQSLVTPQHLDKLGISLHAEQFLVCVARVDQFQSLSGKFQARDIALFKFGMMNIVEETLSTYSTVELLDDSEDSFIIILNMDKGILTTEMTENAIIEAQINIHKFLRMSITVALGGLVEGIGNISYSWKQAFLASRYRLLRGTGTVIPYEEEMAGLTAAHEYPYMLEKQIMDQLKHGAKDKHLAAVDSFFEELAGFHYEELILFLKQMLMMTERTANQMLENDELLHADFIVLSDTIHGFDTLELIRKQYLQICDKIMDYKMNEAAKRLGKIVDKVKVHIHHDYANPELTIDDLAEHVGLSKNYLRKIFNDYCGESISQYLSIYRFEKAKELLLGTEHAAAKVGELVGIANTNYFYISFKKYTGQTPLHYRTANKRE